MTAAPNGSGHGTPGSRILVYNREISGVTPFNQLVICDAYKWSDQSIFDRNVKQSYDAWMSKQPMRSLRERLSHRLYSQFFASNDHGMTNSHGIIANRNTYFGSWNIPSGGLDYDVPLRNSAVAAAAAALGVTIHSSFMLIFGMGGANSGSVPIVDPDFTGLPTGVHEDGHAKAGIGDEYQLVGNQNYPANGPEPTCLNVTKQTNLARVKWRSKLGGAVGLIEGGGYYVHGLYRCQQSCVMNDQYETEFCAACQWQILSMYAQHISGDVGPYVLPPFGFRGGANGSNLFAQTNPWEGQPLAGYSAVDLTAGTFVNPRACTIDEYDLYLSGVPLNLGVTVTCYLRIDGTIVASCTHAFAGGADNYFVATGLGIVLPAGSTATVQCVVSGGDAADCYIIGYIYVHSGFERVATVPVRSFALGEFTQNQLVGSSDQQWMAPGYKTSVPLTARADGERTCHVDCVIERLIVSLGVAAVASTIVCYIEIAGVQVASTVVTIAAGATTGLSALLDVEIREGQRYAVTTYQTVGAGVDTIYARAIIRAH